ncbi:MAG: DUF3592 domain-containing protein [Anaerolineales bacterium]|nr:DUF3592 domain-containing protein [Anaerolineales bacterium]
MINSEILRPLLCGLLCVGGALVVLAGVIAIIVINQKNSREKYAVPKHWLPVQGRITATSIEEAARSNTDEDESYLPMVTFDYAIEGKVYSEKDAVGRPSNLALKARRTLEQYPIGGNITVYYNPEKVDECRLKIP